MKTKPDVVCTNVFKSTTKKELRENLLDKWIAIIECKQKLSA